MRINSAFEIFFSRKKSKKTGVNGRIRKTLIEFRDAEILIKILLNNIGL